jgi:hypothetical protein
VGNSILSWDIDKAEWMQFAGSPVAFKDHANAVEFENELWQMAGRGDRGVSNEVNIWNPVTHEWRAGPSMFHPRSGYAARVVQGQIMVAGGETIEGVDFNMVESMEIYAPGNAGWVFGNPPPIAVHGTSGASSGGQFIVIGGSNDAGSTNPIGPVQTFVPMAGPEQIAEVIPQE